MKTIRKIALVSLIVGLIAAGVSLAMGAYKGEKWMDASKKVRLAQGYYAENMGFHNNELGMFDSIDIDTNHNITIKTGEVAAPELFYEDAYPEQTQVSVSDGKLVIRNKQFENKIFGLKWLVFSFYDDTAEIILTLPAGYAINNIFACSVSESVLIDGVSVTGAIKGKSVSGNVNIKNLTAVSVEAVNTSGKAYAENIKANILNAVSTSGNAEIVNSEVQEAIKVNSTSGSAKVKNSTADKINAQSVSGNVAAESCDANTYELKSVSGRATVTLKGDINDYKFYLSTISGKCTLNGVSQGKTFDTTISDAERPRFISAKSTSGQVEIVIAVEEIL